MRLSILAGLALALACSSSSDGEEPEVNLCEGAADGLVVCPNPDGLVAPDAPRPVCLDTGVNCTYDPLTGFAASAFAPFEAVCMGGTPSCEFVCEVPLLLCPPNPDGMDAGM
ncbi:MAG: hypothetical protein AAGH15_22995 [Myxococcota bacterium]